MITHQHQCNKLKELTRGIVGTIKLTEMEAWFDEKCKQKYWKEMRYIKQLSAKQIKDREENIKEVGRKLTNCTERRRGDMKTSCL